MKAVIAPAAINAAAATIRPDANLLILNPDVRLLPGAAARILAEDGTTQWSLRREPSIMTAWTDAFLGGTFAARIGTGEMIGDPAIYERGGLIEWATGAVLAVAARARGVVPRCFATKPNFMSIPSRSRPRLFLGYPVRPSA